MLPSAATAPLLRHLELVKRHHQDDLARGFGRVVLPFAIERKYVNAATDWRWQFVFPAARLCRDPQFGPPSRYHVHESVVQSARGRLRHSDPPRAAGPSCREHHDDLHARAEPWRVGGQEPGRSPVTADTRERRTYPVDACFWPAGSMILAFKILPMREAILPPLDTCKRSHISTSFLALAGASHIRVPRNRAGTGTLILLLSARARQVSGT
jgi:hypothetical protein